MRLDTFPIMNPLARTRVYTVIVGRQGRGAGRDRSSCWSIASVMLQVQCISLPKRFVPSVSKCPSVVRPSLTSPFCLSVIPFFPPLSLSLARSRSYSLAICSFSIPQSLPPSAAVLLARTHPPGKRRANTPPYTVYTRARGQCSHVN